MGGSTSKFYGAQSVVVEGEAPKNADRSATRRSPLLPSGLVDNMATGPLRNCWHMFIDGGGNSLDAPYLGHRQGSQYRWISRRTTRDAALQIGTALTRLDLCPLREFPDEPFSKARQLRPVGVFLKNCMEWLILEQAANAFGFTLVPLYDTLGNESLIYILEATQLATIVLSLETLGKFAEMGKKVPTVTCLVIVESAETTPNLQRVAQKYQNLTGCTVRLWDDLLIEGQRNTLPATETSLDDVQTLCYTSGTTGVPKGVIFTHGTLIANTAGLLRGPFGATDFTVGSNDVHISYLPLAHVYERIMCCVMTSRGGSIGFYGGNALKLLEDVQLLEPTIFISVPRLYNRINDKVLCGIQGKSALVQRLFQNGLEAKISRLRSTGDPTHKLWDALVFRKIKRILGSRLRFLVAGGAALDATIEERMKALFCVPLMQGYGLTETLGAAFMTTRYDPIVGHVGGPIPWAEFQLESVPEMNYFANAELPAGEVLVRGPGVAKGYFRAIEATNETFEKDGWFHTGDIGVLLPNGAVKLVDRKKNIFKLAQGEYVSPERIEGVYMLAPLVGQIFVSGYTIKSSLVAVVVPEQETAEMWAKNNKKDAAKLVNDNSFRDAVWQEMNKAAIEGGLRGFERVKAIRFVSEPFSVENGLMTPTFKLKRNVAQLHFKGLIDEMYLDLEKTG